MRQKSVTTLAMLASLFRKDHIGSNNTCTSISGQFTSMVKEIQIPFVAFWNLIGSNSTSISRKDSKWAILRINPIKKSCSIRYKTWIPSVFLSKSPPLDGPLCKNWLDRLCSYFWGEFYFIKHYMYIIMILYSQSTCIM